ncbi:MAG: cellobiose phosphorylase, partial [Candidatus Aenigmatarchaeota archaeon]
HKSGDLNILLKETTYFKDHLVKRAKEIDKNFSQKDFLLRTKYKKLYKGSLLEHLLIQNIVPFFNVGEHNIIKLENADWNDGLDMAAKRGESVAFSFMYAHNLTVLCILLEKLKEKIKRVKILKELTILLDRINKPINYNSFKEKQKLLEVYLEKTKSISGEKLKIDIDKIIKDLKEKSIHLGNWLRKKEWLEFGFFNGYYDNKGKRVEGKFKNKTRLMLASQVFAIMSGIPTKEQIKQIFISVKKYLKDKNLGGFRLNTNFYIPHYLDLGRAFGFSYGDKENGAFFNHMVIMFAFALYKQGPIKEANEVFSSIYKMATNSKSEIYPMIPEYFNAEGKGLYFYLTGSGSWYIYTLLEEVLGIKFRFGDILIKPKFNSSLLFDRKIEVKFNIYNRILRVSYLCKKKKNIFNLKSVFLENKEI